MPDLLWRDSKAINHVDFSSCETDLELGELAALMFQGMRAEEALKILAPLTTCDVDTIAFRQNCIRDLLNFPELTSTFEYIGELVEEIAVCTNGIRENAEGLTNHSGLNGFKETLDKLEALFGSKSNMIDENDLDNYYGQLFRASIFLFRLAKAYTEAVSYLREKLTAIDIQSDALKQLRAWISEIYIKDAVQSSQLLIEEISQEWDSIEAFNIDILVDQTLNITGIELTSIESSAYVKEGVLTARVGDAASGLARLCEFPQGGATARFQECLITALGTSLRSKLVKLRDRVVRIPCRAAKELISINEQLRFYIAESKFLSRLNNSETPICCPEYHKHEFIMKVKGAYPVSVLMIHGKKSVGNDIILPRQGHVNFITGANSSGKTTLLITAGQLQWLYQLGWWLPCVKASLQPVDGVFTLFASGETEDVSDSRMGLEAQKLEFIRNHATENSIVLLNEPMTSTSAGEGIQICIHMLREFVNKHISCMIVTHYNEMYKLLENELSNVGLEDSLDSYVMDVQNTPDGIVYPYSLVKREPGRSSYASEIVNRAGLNLEAMLETLNSAGLPVMPESPLWKRFRQIEEVL